MALTDLGPFADAGLLLLASLAAGPKHGYAMLADVEEMAGARTDSAFLGRVWPSG